MAQPYLHLDLTESAHIDMTRYEPMIRTIARRQANRQKRNPAIILDEDDMYNIAYLEFLRSMVKNKGHQYQVNKAILCAKYSLWKIAKKLSKEYLETTPDLYETAYSNAQDYKNEIDARELEYSEIVSKVFENVPTGYHKTLRETSAGKMLNRKIARLVYLEGKTAKEAAVELGITEWRVEDHLARIIRPYLRAAMRRYYDVKESKNA